MSLKGLSEADYKLILELTKAQDLHADCQYVYWQSETNMANLRDVHHVHALALHNANERLKNAELAARQVYAENQNISVWHANAETAKNLAEWQAWAGKLEAKLIEITAEMRKVYSPENIQD